MKPKFNIGDEVKFFKDTDFQAGKILFFAYAPEAEEFRYTFTSKAYDPGKNEMIEGVKTCLESELVEIGTDPVKDKVVESKKENE